MMKKMNSTKITMRSEIPSARPIERKRRGKMIESSIIVSVTAAVSKKTDVTRRGSNSIRYMERTNPSGSTTRL